MSPILAKLRKQARLAQRAVDEHAQEVIAVPADFGAAAAAAAAATRSADGAAMQPGTY